MRAPKRKRMLEAAASEEEKEAVQVPLPLPTPTPTPKAWLSSLSEDEFIEILLRLPVDSLHRFKCVSKRWLHLISAPHFIRRYCCIHRACSSSSSPTRDQLVLYIVKYEYERRHYEPPDDVGDFGHLNLLLDSNSNNNDHHYNLLLSKFDSSFSFLPVLRDRPVNERLRKSYCLKDFEVLAAASNGYGLFLCRVLFKPRLQPHCRPSSLYVCNPLTKDWLELPPLQRRYTAPLGPTGFLCHPHPDGHHLPPLGFTVLELENRDYLAVKADEHHFFAHVFTTSASASASASASWNIHRLACPPGRSVRWYRYSSLVVAPNNGVFYWDGISHLVVYDPLNQPHRCNFIDFPQRTASSQSQLHHLSTSQQGKLLMLTLQRQGFKVWELINNNANANVNAWHVIYNHVSFPDTNPWIQFGAWSQTNKEIVCLIKRGSWKLLLFNMEDDSHSDFELPINKGKADCVGEVSTLLFNLPVWPTPIPQLLQQDQDYH